jgi:putative membrane protein
VTVEPFLLESGQRLALFVVSGVLVSLVGVRVAAHLGSSEVVGADLEAADSEPAERESDAESEAG